MVSIIFLLTMLVSPAYAESGIASHYSATGAVACPGHRGSGGMVAAHRSLPCGSKVKVTNNRTGKTVEVTIIDRGPFIHGRIIDLSNSAANALGFNGLTSVTISK